LSRFREPPARQLSDEQLAALYAPPKVEPVEQTEARLLSKEEEIRFTELLVAHDVEGALVKAFLYAMKRTDEDERLARELQLRAYSLLWERRTWDPSKFTLAAYLCGVVRSLVSHDARERETRDEYEEAAATETATLQARHAPSPEDMAVEMEQADENRRNALRELEPLRQAFVEARDKTNLVWMKLRLDGLETPAEMAAATGIDVNEFYRAKERRDRHVKRLVAARRAKAREDKENG